ncbi:MAG: trypsin-like serine protease, partial [Bacteriovoracia bacterium]
MLIERRLTQFTRFIFLAAALPSLFACQFSLFNGQKQDEGDSDAVELAITSPAANSYINSANNSSTFAVSGTCTMKGVEVKVQVDGADAASQVGGTCDGEEFSATISTTGLSAGAHTLSAVLSQNGSDNTSDDVAVTKDIVAPTVAITTPAAAAYINAAANTTTYTVSGTCSENGKTVAILVDGVSATGQVGGACNGTNFSSTINVTGLAQNGHTLSATLADNAGNAGTAANVAVTKDSVAPTVAVTSPAGGASIDFAQNSTTYAVSGTCNENGRTVTVKIDGAAVTTTGGVCNGTNFSATVDTTALSQASHTFSASLSDLAGNSTSAANISVTKALTNAGAPAFASWMGILRSDNNYVCMAVLIAESYAITTGQCADDATNSGGSLDILFGSEDEFSPNAVATGVQSITYHPNYNSVTLDHDLAILVLKIAVTPTGFVEKIVIPTNEWSFPALTMAYQFGYMSPGYVPNTAWLAVEGLVMGAEETVAAHQGYATITSNMLGAQSQGGAGKCVIDRGSSLVALDSGGGPVLAGIMSFAGPDCETYPNIYTRVSL